MRQTTLLYLRQKNKILLAMKKRGFGEGKLNGVGGKVSQGESVAVAAIREAKEEIGVDILEADLEFAGTVNFHFIGRDAWNQECHVFFVRIWQGVPVESEEMAPCWVDDDKLPLSKMWVGDRYWLPVAISGEEVKVDLFFNEDGSEVKSYNIESSGLKEAV